jgi:hypothetical protein
MKALLLLAMATAIQFSATGDPQTKGNVALMTWEEDGRFHVCVKLLAHDSTVDHAIVRVGFMVHSDELKTDLWISNTVVTPVDTDIWFAANSVPLAAFKVRRIEVTLVHDVDKETFGDTR